MLTSLKAAEEPRGKQQGGPALRPQFTQQQHLSQSGHLFTAVIYNILILSSRHRFFPLGKAANGVLMNSDQVSLPRA